METILTTALGFLVSLVKDTEGAKKAKNEVFTAFWDWVKPIFIVEEKETKVLKDLKEKPDDELNQQSALTEMKKYLRDHPQEGEKLTQLIKQLQSEGNEPAQTNITQIHYGSGDNVGRDKNS